MRVTFTLDDDLADLLHAIARKEGRELKEVTNEAIRLGLSTWDAQRARPNGFLVRPKACGFRAGVDPLKLNQVHDDLELRRAL